MKRPATQKMTVGDFRRISEDLLIRGFREDAKNAGGGVLHEGMVISSYSREISSFTLKVGASQEATDAIAAFGKRVPEDQMMASLWAKCVTKANRNVSEFTHMHGHKCHYVAPDGEGGTYHADLVPFPDPSILIDSCLKLSGGIERLKGDAEFRAAIDAREVEEKILEAKKGVKEGNGYRNYLEEYLKPMLDSLANKIKYEFNRIKGDPILQQALALVADRGA